MKDLREYQYIIQWVFRPCGEDGLRIQCFYFDKVEHAMSQFMDIAEDVDPDAGEFIELLRKPSDGGPWYKVVLTTAAEVA